MTSTIFEVGPANLWTGASIVISDEDGAPIGWTRAVPPHLAEGEEAVFSGNVWIAIPRPPPPSTVDAPGITYKADVWRRATEAQAAVIDTELQKLDVRRRRMWDDSMYLDHSDELVAFFRTMLTQTFGATEANRILAPSNV